jgi:hypothetical protein
MNDLSKDTRILALKELVDKEFAMTTYLIKNKALSYDEATLRCALTKNLYEKFYEQFPELKDDAKNK